MFLPGSFAPPKVFKVGMVVEFQAGARSLLVAELHGIFTARNLGRTDDYFVSEEFLQDHAWPTAVQPGQIYDGKPYQYKVLAALDGKKWECEIVGVGHKYKIPEPEIHFNWALVQGLDAVPTRSHGPHRCPRCQRMGAQILARTVECVNPKCPCFVPLKG